MIPKSDSPEPTTAGSQILRNVLGTGTRQAMQVVLGLVFSITVARVLGPEGNGQYAVSILLPALLIQFMNLGIPSANVVYIGSGTVNAKVATVASWSLSLMVAAAGVAIGLIAIFLLNTTVFSDVPALYVIVALLGFPPALHTAFSLSILHGSKSFGRFNVLGVVQPAITVSAGIVALLVFEAGVFGAIGAYTAGQFVAGLVATVLVRQLTGKLLARRRLTDVLTHIRRAFGYGWKAHLSNITTFLSYRLDILLLNSLAGTGVAGLYVVAVRIVEQLWILSAPISTVLLPSMAAWNLTGDRFPGRTASLARITLMFSLPAALVLALLSPLLVPAVFGEAYRDSVPPLLVLLPGIILMAAGRITSNDIASRKRPELNLYVALATLISNIGLNVLWIPRHGALGAAMATSLSYCIDTTLKSAVYCRLEGISLGAYWRPTKADIKTMAWVIRKLLGGVRGGTLA